MITIKNVRTLSGKIINHTLPSLVDHEIDAKEKLTLFPGLLDPHVSFGPVDSENWDLAIQSAIRGGVTSAIEVPTRKYPLATKKDFERKIQKTTQRLQELNFTFRDFIYASADLEHTQQLGLGRKLIKGVVILLDPEKKEFLDDSWEELFRIAAQEDLPVVINSQNEHSEYLEKAIELTEKLAARLYVLNVSTKDELDLIQDGRKRSILIYAETTPQHLFEENSDFLWQSLENGVIETVGSGYFADKQDGTRLLYHGGNFSVLDPVFLLPRMLTAFHEGKISLEKLARVLCLNVLDIFEIEKANSAVLVDLEKEETLQKVIHQHSSELKLRGWPEYTIIDGHVFSPPQKGYQLISQD